MSQRSRQPESGPGPRYCLWQLASAPPSWWGPGQVEASSELGPSSLSQGRARALGGDGRAAGHQAGPGGGLALRASTSPSEKWGQMKRSGAAGARGPGVSQSSPRPSPPLKEKLKGVLHPQKGKRDREGPGNSSCFVPPAWVRTARSTPSGRWHIEEVTWPHPALVALPPQPTYWAGGRVERLRIPSLPLPGPV